MNRGFYDGRELCISMKNSMSFSFSCDTEEYCLLFGLSIDCRSGDPQKPDRRSYETAHLDSVHAPVEPGKDWSAPMRCSGRIGLTSTLAGSVASIRRRVAVSFDPVRKMTRRGR